MTTFQIPDSFEIPPYDHGNNIFETVKNSSKRRKMNPVSFFFRKVKNTILARWAYRCPLNSWRITFNRWRGAHIGDHCYLGTHIIIDNAYPEMFFMGDYSSVNQGSTILTHTNAMSFFTDAVKCQVNPVVVEDHSTVGVNCTLLPGAKVGEYSVVSAGSVVVNKVPSYTMVIGNPAKKWVSLKKMVKE
jgi:acetyltransferase-like isoleucine patch superfamily enzyme